MAFGPRKWNSLGNRNTKVKRMVRILTFFFFISVSLEESNEAQSIIIKYKCIAIMIQKMCTLKFVIGRAGND